MPTISESAKARGQTGFLHPQHNYTVSASGRHCADEWTTRNKRLAMQKFTYLVRATRNHGRYFSACVTLECDGVEIDSNRKTELGVKRKNQYA